jgi:hypothetical protein
MTTRTLLQNIKRRLPHYLDHNVAQCAGLRLENLQEIIGGTLIPTPEQQTALARRMSLPEFPTTREVT